MLESFSSFVKRALFVNVPVAIAAIGNHDQAVVVFSLSLQEAIVWKLVRN